VRIAVLGNGVQRNHPDLAANILNGFDVLGQNNNGDATGNHETLVAGVAAAVGNNNLGAAGVAYNCRIVPIRFIAGDGAANLLGDIATAFNWAWQQNRSDVIVMSWSGGNPNNVLDAAIAAAIAQGRPRPNGPPLGCVVVINSGNSNQSTVDYLSDLPGVMSVGATDNQDRRADFSNYGTDLDVVAPGVDIFGTDQVGAAGYAGGDFATRPGTSFAAPQVAGIAALLLSVNPNLTQQQVRNLIELTCDKVGLGSSWPGYQTTAGRPNGTWHEEMGYGRVNAANALRRALGGITGPAVVCVGNGPGTFSIPNPQLPNPPTWTASPNLQVTGNGNSATAVQVGGNGPGWVEATWPSPCGGNPIRLRWDVVVGPPLPPFNFQGYAPGLELCPNSPYSFVALAQPYNYTATVVSGVGTATYSAFSQSLTVTIQGTAPLIVQIQVTHPGFPGCPSASFNLTFYPKNCTDPCLRPLVTYPNPSSGRLVVSFEEVAPGRAAPPDPCRPSRIQVFNRFGQVVREVELGDLAKKGPLREVVLDTQGLPAGVYFLHIQYENQVVKQQVMIE
jgi:hypothetical protein